MVLKSYSKINLTLKVNSKNKNGLHEIQSLFCLINLIDNINVKKINKNKDEINYFVEEGTVEFSDNSLLILTSTAKEVKDMDKKLLESIIDDAEKKIKS